MTITVTPTAQPSNVPPRVQLNVSASAGETSTTVTRINPDGTVTTVRTLDGGPLALSGGAGLLFDYEMSFGAGVSYSSTQSPATISAQVTVDVASAWLIHPGVPDLSLPVTVGSITDRTRAVQRAVLQPIGREFPWTATDGQRKAAQFSLTVYTADEDGRASLYSLLEDTNVLMLNVPAGKGWGITAEYVSVGEVTEARPFRLMGLSDRMITLPMVVVDRPAGGTASERVWNDVTGAYATWNAVTAAYASWNAVLAGP